MTKPQISCDAEDCPFEGQPKDRRGWHLERSIGLDVVIAFLSLLFSGVAYVIHEDSRVTKVEDRATALEASDVRQEKAQTDYRGEVRSDLKGINDKLDRLIERRQK